MKGVLLVALSRVVKPASDRFNVGGVDRTRVPARSAGSC
jgi:hypothetical protein